MTIFFGFFFFFFCPGLSFAFVESCQKSFSNNFRYMAENWRNVGQDATCAQKFALSSSSPPLLLSGCPAVWPKAPKAAKIKFSKQHAHHAYRHTDNIYDGGTDTDDDECPLEATAMNPYEYESTLDCRDAGGGPAPPHAHAHAQALAVAHPHAQGRTLPMSGHGRPVADIGATAHGSQTLQHQNQQNQQAAQQSHYDYEYQHLAHRPPDTANNTAQRTHGRQVITPLPYKMISATFRHSAGSCRYR
ncbi:hypothetical protein M5D96_009281 [Drosophila gunungcola]|uniref:Secreted protein n=1 Tax=Drosophila gunungcola TaxID=103775 RepID=A0A9P9YIS9_9MUSC|nr:hypothetical protein M5D96_009281 [Drosophila gunungcola]